MNLSLQRYVNMTKRTSASIGAEVGFTRQAVDKMLSSGSPVFIECEHGANYEKIAKMYRYDVLFANESNHGETL